MYDVKTKTIDFDYFDVSVYSHNKILINNSINNYDLDNYYTGNFIPTSILGNDERIPIINPKISPYLPTVKIVSFYNIFNKNLSIKKIESFTGTGFLISPNLILSAAHCVYGDISNKNEYDDGIFNPKFSEKVEIFAGLNGKLEEEQNSKYKYYAKVIKINIHREYFENLSYDHDWTLLELDKDLGNYTGYYNICENWYEKNSNVYSYGYPGDKNSTMWETHGKLLSKTTYTYNYDFDTKPGQSGSPVFMTNSENKVYVCGIHTSGSNNFNSATIINSFIYHFSKNYQSLIGIIKPTDYNFPDAYTTSEYLKNNYISHTLPNGFTFKTKRYRTGFIHNEYIVMSPFRENINEAFISYKFEVPISKIEIDLAHWRELSHEWTRPYYCHGHLRIPLGNGKYKNLLDLIDEKPLLPTDRTKPKTFVFEFDKPIYEFELYIKSDVISVNNSNRGRICIGDIKIYSKQ